MTTKTKKVKKETKTIQIRIRKENESTLRTRVRIKSMLKENNILYSDDELEELSQEELEIILDENSKVLEERRKMEEKVINESNAKYK